MRVTTLVSELTFDDLSSMKNGEMENTLTDLDFLETLAANKCFLLPPFVMRARGSGKLMRVARISYDADGQINKPLVLLNALNRLAAMEMNPPPFTQRLRRF